MLLMQLIRQSMFRSEQSCIWTSTDLLRAFGRCMTYNKGLIQLSLCIPLLVLRLFVTVRRPPHMTGTRNFKRSPRVSFAAPIHADAVRGSEPYWPVTGRCFRDALSQLLY